MLAGRTSLVIVLARDGRAVVNSRLRKYLEIATAWVAQMHGTEDLASRFPGPVLRVRYKELASRPERTLRALADFVGIVFDPTMLTPRGSEQHPLGGNDGTPFLLVCERAKRTSGWCGSGRTQ
ncbi:MAG: sulfotransferase [Egibacteraceae bacterium]